MQRCRCLRILSTCCMTLCLLIAHGLPLQGGEPVADFLDQLRENQYYELAIVYLDRIEKGQIPASEADKTDVMLDRGLTLRMAAVASRSAKERDQRFDESEAALRKFLETQPNSTRIEEARLQLATLLLVRGARLAETPKADDAMKKRAEELLSGAAKAYDEIVEKLREKLTAMQGQKIDDNDEKVNLRNTYRSQYLAALLSGGTARQRLASLLPKDSPERKKFLEEALQKFSELTDKHAERAQGALAQLHRGQVQEELGKPDAALDSYSRLVELDVSDVEDLRDARVEAATQLVRLWLNKDPPVYKPAIEKGSMVLTSMTPMDKVSPKWQALGLQTAKAYLAQVDAQTKEKAGTTKINASKKEARRLLIAAAKVPGDHQEEATKLLSGLGVDTEAGAAQVVKVKNFGEAVGRARELMEEAENSATPLKLIEDKLAATPNDETLQKQKSALVEEISQKRTEAIALLQRAPGMATEETTVDDINQSRFYLAYLLWREERNREALVVANFICRKYPSSALAPQAGLIAVTAYQAMIGQSGDKVSPSVVKGLENLSLYLVERWPNDAAAKTASEILVRVALNQGRWKDAEGYLVKIPEDAPQRSTLQQLIGQLQWNEYLKLIEEKKKPESDQALDRVIASFAKGLKDVKAENVDSISIQSALLLAKAHLRKDNPAAAKAVLDNPVTGPLQRVDGEKAVADVDPNLVIDSYRTGLQVLVTLSTDSGSESGQLDRAASLIDKLREAVKSQPDAEKRLVAIYYGLAKDIRDELDQATPERRAKLISAFRLLLDKLAQTTEDTSTLLWIGQTFSEIGQSLIPANSTGAATGQAKELLDSAIEAYNKALKNAPADSEPIRLRLARAARLGGEYKVAIDELEKVLTAKPMMIDAQVEGAQAFQDWAAVGSEKLYEVAMAGGRKNARGQATIWGWGKISVITNGKPQFQETFYEARYKLAECRYLFAKRQKTPDDVKRWAEQASKDINTVATVFPTMGGPEMRARFDQLMKNVQTLLGQQPTGLPPAAENSSAAAPPASNPTR